MVSTTTLSLKEWIKGAVGGGDNPLTPAYLAAALRVAKYLTEQIGDAEELSAVGLSSGVDSLPLPYPYTCYSWSECIAVDVVLPSSSGSPLSQDAGSLADEHELHTQIQNCSLDDFPHEGRGNKIPNSIRTQTNAEVDDASATHLWGEHGMDYHNVHSAEISSSSANSLISYATDCADVNKDKMQRIYSLGVAFYVLFSGGDPPPPELLVISLPDGSFSAMSVTSPPPDDDELRASSPSSKRQSNPNLSGSTVDSSECSSNSRVINNVNLEYLRMKGVPDPLCDLIHNMVDCINGDFVRDETYVDISDVTYDLKFMIEEPRIYLNGVDANELARIGLQLNDTLFDRSADIDTLQAAYERTNRGSRELAILCGSSGTGKTTLANQFVKLITSNGGHFLSCKFDQMKEVEGFSKVASAFNRYIDDMATNEIDHARNIASKLCQALGQDVYYLAHVLPSLQNVINQDTPNTKSTNHQYEKEYVNAKQRKLYVFSQLVEVICKCSRQSLVLLIDDIQWADLASISLIHQVLKTSGSMLDGKQIFLLACYRDDEMQDDHPLWDVLKSICSHGFTKTDVKLECDESETVKQALSRLLHLTPRLVHSLSEIIYRKTKGNPLFMTRMLRSLNRERLLRINLVRRRWEWDESAIQLQMLPDDVATFFIEQISSLPQDSATALAHLSCFGASVRLEIVEALEQNLALQLVSPLEDAIKAGLIDQRVGRYHFPHDRIQEAAYASIGEQHRSHYHMVFGLSLVDLATRTNDDALLFTSVTQLNIGGPSAVFNVAFFAANAKYNLIAGKKAMSFAEFASALKYFNHGITFLRTNHWQEQYDLTLELFTLAARCALAVNDIARLTTICNSVSQHARNLDDMLDTSLTLMIPLVHQSLHGSVDYGISILLKLGIHIPESPNQVDILNEMSATRMMLSQLSNEMISSYSIMSEYKHIMAMKFLAKLVLPVREVRPSLLPLVAIKMINFTVEHGLSPMSSFGFALFGGIVAMVGGLREGHRYTKLALSLVGKFENSNVTGELICTTIHTMTYIEPYSMLREELNRGFKHSMTAGSIFTACLNQLIYCRAMLSFGVKLKEQQDGLEKADRFINKERKLLTPFSQTILMHQHYISKLMRDESQPEINVGVIMDETFFGDMHPGNVIVKNFLEIFSSLVFNNYDDMKKCGEKFKEKGLQSWLLLSSYSFQFFVIGLVYYRIFRETCESMWAEKAKEYQDKIESWCEQGSSHTFEHRQCLMKAEEANSFRDFENAEVFYNRAILLAKQNSFILDCALACELAAHFHLKLDNAPKAFKYYTIAYWKYVDWGAAAKFRQMEKFSRRIFNVGFPAEAQDFFTDYNIDLPEVNRKRERL